MLTTIISGIDPEYTKRPKNKALKRVIKKWGYLGTLMLAESVTPHGGVETEKEGEIYANFLRENRGKFEGVILCLPNFGDENGAVQALKNAGVPILIQAYPDDLDNMNVAQRRDAFCGKVSVMDAIGLRCWTELQKQLGISPCVVLGDLNECRTASACEVDLGNAIIMKALSLASGEPVACLDWNNNYDDDENKCIIFHCGPIPRHGFRHHVSMTQGSVIGPVKEAFERYLGFKVVLPQNS